MSIHTLVYCGFLLLGFGLFSPLQAQITEGDKIKNPGGFKIPSAKEEGNTEKTSDTLKEDNKSDFSIPFENPDEDPQREGGVSFNPFKTPSLMNEELNSIDVGEALVVKVSEEINIGEYNDSAWVRIAEYYAVWDATYINPYQSNAASFNEIINIELYNPDKGLMWSPPLSSTLQTSPFGPRWGRYHHGLDLNLRTGDPIYSVFDGIVRIAGYNSGYGYYVVVRHYNGLETLYGHMSQLKVESRQKVKSGQIIGLGGSTGYSTGPHLHFEVRYQGNSINPALLFDFGSVEAPSIRSQYFTLLPEHFSHYGNQVRTNIYHQVLLGETLESIGQKYNISASILAESNQLEADAELKVGQRLKIK